MNKTTHKALKKAIEKITAPEPLDKFNDYMIGLLRESGREPRFKVSMRDFNITGRMGKRTIECDIDLILEIEGRRFSMGTVRDKWKEDDTLSIDLPREALVISSA